MKNYRYWIPTAIIVVAAATVAIIYHEPLIGWFRPHQHPGSAASATSPHTGHGHGGGPAAATGSPAINDVCPVLGGDIDAESKTIVWNGHVIGFCCPPCEDDWNALAQSQRQAFVDRFAGQERHVHEPQPRRARDLPADEIAHYTCSMHPSVRSRDPGTCPICRMDLEPVTHEELRSGVVFVDAQRRQLIGVRTQPVGRRELTMNVRALGIVAYDQTRLTDVSLKYRGWTGDVWADYIGKRVERGQPLFTIYSPELLTAQQEYIDALATGRSADSARTKLTLWDVTDEQLEALRERRQPQRFVEVLSQASGTVIEKNIVRGSAVEPGSAIYRIADLSVVWVEAELYESELPHIQVGSEALVALSHSPHEPLKGTVSYIYPYLDPRTRRGRVRIEVPNPAGLLKPDMYANVQIHLPLGERLAIPQDAILYAGESRVVFVDLGGGRMKPQWITTGSRAGEWIEVLAGLEEGEKIVTSGNFFIAAESRLKSGIEKW